MEKLNEHDIQIYTFCNFRYLDTMKCYMLIGIVLVTLMSSIYLASTYCNEALCASIVSKCMLLKSCKCDFTNTTKCECCKDCHKCLSSLYTDCCVCVGKFIFFVFEFSNYFLNGIDLECELFV